MAVAEKRARGSRGKKNKSVKEQDQDQGQRDNAKPGKTFQGNGRYSEGGDESSRPGRPDRRAQIDNAAIFGFIDPEVQQYFKGVEKTLDEMNFEAVEGIVPDTGCLNQQRGYLRVFLLTSCLFNLDRDTAFPGERLH